MLITPKMVKDHKLSPDEYARALVVLGREPTWTELGVLSVMWSEHCSYKSSKKHLARLPTTGKNVVIGPGENAGVVDIGDGWCVAFKMESHNHPSADRTSRRRGNRGRRHPPRRVHDGRPADRRARIRSGSASPRTRAPGT